MQSAKGKMRRRDKTVFGDLFGQMAKKCRFPAKGPKLKCSHLSVFVRIFSPGKELIHSSAQKAHNSGCFRLNCADAMRDNFEGTSCDEIPFF
jgi:hypothetical protein